MNKLFNIVILWLLDRNGSQLLTGGIERWCRDLALLINNKGYHVTIFQKAEIGFEKFLSNDVRVIGVPCPLTFRGNWKLSRWLERNCDIEEPFVYVSQEIALSKKIHRAVAINHGIWWDGDMPWYKKWLNKRLQYRLLMRLRGVICVDTNYINWCHAELSNRILWEKKLFYVPNYADLKRFNPEKLDDHRYLTILFPRRVSVSTLDRDGRGAGLLLKAAEILENRGLKLRLIFSGRGSLQEDIKRWALERGMKDRVEVFEVSLDDMSSVYHMANVVVIPSLAHEGTSFSAVEALASGKSTVVSHIGGLANIILDGLNGYICDLSPDSLANAIEKAINHPLLENETILQAVRKSLGKERWEQQVWNMLLKKLDL